MNCSRFLGNGNARFKSHSWEQTAAIRFAPNLHFTEGDLQHLMKALEELVLSLDDNNVWS